MFNTGNKKPCHISWRKSGLSIANTGVLTMNSMTQINDNINFDALLTFDEVKQHDHNNIGVMRRIALITLTKSYDELMQIIQSGDDGEEAFMTVFEQSNSYVDYLKELLGLAEAAQARLFVVGEDFLKQLGDAT